MYSISYHMQSGATVHRSPNAEAAMELVSMIAMSGGRIDMIVVTRTGKQISVVELRQLAEDETRADATQAPRAAQLARRRSWWPRLNSIRRG